MDSAVMYRLWEKSETRKEVLEFINNYENDFMYSSEYQEIAEKFASKFLNEEVDSSIYYIERNDKLCLKNSTIRLMFINNNIEIKLDPKPEIKTNIGWKTAPTLPMGWVIYILSMLGVSIFNDRVTAWVAFTIIFIIWRILEIIKYN